MTVTLSETHDMPEAKADGRTFEAQDSRGRRPTGSVMGSGWSPRTTADTGGDMSWDLLVPPVPPEFISVARVSGTGPAVCDAGLESHQPPAAPL